MRSATRILPLIFLFVFIVAAPRQAHAQTPRPAASATRAAAAPASQPTTRQYQTFAMSHMGDPARGKSLFINDAKLACAKCHSTEAGAQDAKVGPTLSAIGDRF